LYPLALDCDIFNEATLKLRNLRVAAT